MLLSLVSDLGEHGVVTRGSSRGKERSPQLLLAELGGAGKRAKIEFQVLGILGEAGLQVIDRHLLQTFLQFFHLVDVLGRVVLLPVAGTDLFRLKGIKNTQHLIDVAANGIGCH